MSEASARIYKCVLFVFNQVDQQATSERQIRILQQVTPIEMSSLYQKELGEFVLNCQHSMPTQEKVLCSINCTAQVL